MKRVVWKFWTEKRDMEVNTSIIRMSQGRICSMSIREDLEKGKNLVDVCISFEEDAVSLEQIEGNLRIAAAEAGDEFRSVEWDLLEEGVFQGENS